MKGRPTVKKALIITNLEKNFSAGNYSMIDPLKDLGFEVTCASNFSEYEGDISTINCKTVHIDFIRSPFDPRNIRSYSQMLRLLSQENFDLVHCNHPISGLIGRLCARQLSISPVIYTAHGFMFFQGAPLRNWLLYYPAELLLARLTDCLITINQEDYEQAKNFKLRKNGGICYIPGVGVNTALIESAISRRQEILNLFNLPHSAFLLISVGEFNKNKNNHVIIKALGQLQNPNIHYLLCGIGNLQDELINLARENNIEANVHFLGYRTDIPQLLKSSDCFVMPSYREGLPQAIMEAMSAGLPCIVSRIRGHVDLIEDGRGGYLCPPDDIGGFAEAFRRVSENDSLRDDMGQFNLQAVQKYDIERVKEEMLHLYSRILSDGQ